MIETWTIVNVTIAVVIADIIVDAIRYSLNWYLQKIEDRIIELERTR